MCRYSMALTNFPGSAVEHELFYNLDHTIKRAKNICFEAVIYHDGVVIGEWSPISGYRGK
jgi:hypothetical protein